PCPVALFPRPLSGHAGPAPAPERVGGTPPSSYPGWPLLFPARPELQLPRGIRTCHPVCPACRGRSPGLWRYADTRRSLLRVVPQSPLVRTLRARGRLWPASRDAARTHHGAALAGGGAVCSGIKLWLLGRVRPRTRDGHAL